MRAFLVAASVVAVAAPASAQPARQEMRAEMCGVTFVRAPDEVRHVIEKWLEAEPRCSSSIDLRVVATPEGLYLLAQRPDGRIHERIVPDAQTAGVLVASWVADDWTEPPLAALPAERPLAVAADPTRIGAPGLVVAAAPERARPEAPGKWLTVGMGVASKGSAARIEAELVAIGPWRLGAIAGYGSGNYELGPDGDWMFGNMHVEDKKLLASIARNWRSGRWELRAGFAAGVARTHASVFGATTQYTPPGYGSASYAGETDTPAMELSALVTRRLGESWGVALGPVLTIMQQTFEDDAVPARMERDATQLYVFGGLRYDL